MTAASSPKTTLKVALAGNPNCGKTTLFNELTGLRQQVANYPGVTVDVTEGRLHWRGRDIRLIDLPGIYSLSASSAEERTARSLLVDERPDAVVVIVDASQLERGLFLATQVMELRLPTVLVLNMMDQAEARGLRIDESRLSAFFDVPVVKTVGHKGRGIETLKDRLAALSESGRRPPSFAFSLGPDLDGELNAVAEEAKDWLPAGWPFEIRWTLQRWMESDPDVRDRLAQAAPDAAARLDKRLEPVLSLWERRTGVPFPVYSAEKRYGVLAGICREVVVPTLERRLNVSDQVDGVLLHHVFGLPIFFLLMFIVFKLTFSLGAPLMSGVEWFFGYVSASINAAWPEGSADLLRSLLVDGIIGGVGGVLVFLPVIVLLFLWIALLEDSGYLARGAFLMDRIMHRLGGLHGKSFIPMVIGFGCTVPAILATRILESRRDRLITMFVVPLVSCGARFPIYMLIIPAFFPPAWQAPMLWIIYLIGILLAMLCARLLSSTLFQGEATPFVMELPPYRMPAPRSLLISMWDRARLYLRKAATIILAISVVLWALCTFPMREPDPSRSEAEQRSAAMEHSIAGRIGHLLEPVLKPMGFDWKIGTALIGAFAAKEVFVAQMGIVYSEGGDAESTKLRVKLRATYSPLVGLCIMLFCLVGNPCMATVAATRAESRSWKWALAQFGGLTLLAWLLTVAVYQAGRALGF